MSAWRIGTSTAVHQSATAGAARAGAERAGGVEGGGGAARAAAPEPPATPSIDTLVKWIPGEVIATYSAIVLALQPDAGDLKITSSGLLIAGIVAAAAVTFAAGWSATDDLDGRATRELAARTVFAAGAFAIWSLVVPGSAWYGWGEVADAGEAVPLAAAFGGALYALIAEGSVRRIGRPRPGEV